MIYHETEHGVGIDLNHEYCDIAVQRITAELQQAVIDL